MDVEETIGVGEDKAKGKEIGRAIVVVTCVVFLTVGLGVGLGLGLKKHSCYNSLQHVPNSHEVTEEKIKECPSISNLECPVGKTNPLLIVVSLDGFRADYLLRKMTPNMEKMSQCGVHAPYMRAMFPTKTFPNHLSIATGLHVESHGILDNYFHDFEYNRTFSIRTHESLDKRWYNGEPIWNTIKKSGKKVLTMMWPGSSVDIQDMRPDYCYFYDKSIGHRAKIEEVLAYFDSKDVSKHPDAAFIYISQPDIAGHAQGPYGDWVQSNLTMVDNLLGKLVNGLMDKGYKNCINFVVVADHGMERMNCKMAVNISQYLDMNNYYVYGGVHARITSKYVMDANSAFVRNPNPIPVKETLSKLKCDAFDNMKDWCVRSHAKEDLPKRYHYSKNRNIDEIVLDMQPRYAALAFKDSKCLIQSGYHGSDNTYSSMHAIFLGMGSSFKRMDVGPFENIELFNLFADLVGATPVLNNGTYGRLHFILNGSKPDVIVADPNTIDYKTCPLPGSLLERNDIRKRAGIPPLNTSCFGDSEEALDKKLLLSDMEEMEAVTLHLLLDFPGWGEAQTTCKLIHKDHIMAFNSQFHMPLWSSFTLSYNKSSPSNVLEGKWLSDARKEECLRADVRDKEIINYSLFENKQLGIKRAFLFPPGFTKNEADLSNSHVTTNIVPMYEQFEAVVWKELLHLIEEYAEKYQVVNVLAGPIFDYDADGLADSPEDIKEFVDDSKTVPIPTHFFVVLTRCPTHKFDAECLSSLEVLSIILPHKNSTENCWEKRVDDYFRENVARVKDVELLTGLSLLTAIKDKESKTRMETNLSEKLWTRWSWFDVDPDSCPKLPDKPECPDGYQGRGTPLFLISIDGFRPDYLQRNLTPTLERLYKCGATHSSMTSIYPTMTFPNHYSIITGLYAESHGVVDNNMYDVNLNESFILDAPNSYKSHWWNAEPLWSRVMNNNKTAMIFFWPGSDVEILDKRPNAYAPYYNEAPAYYRIRTVLDWLDGKAGNFPDLVSIYFNIVDEAGHDGGPNSYQIIEALIDVENSMQVLMDGLYRRRLHNCMNVIVVSDHGMADIPPGNRVNVSQSLTPEILEKTYMFEGASPRIATRFAGDLETMVRVEESKRANPKDIRDKLRCTSSNMVPYLKKDFPKKFHYCNHDRIDEVLLLIAETWLGNSKKVWTYKGHHGWDALYESMKALFIGWGPSFKEKTHFNESFENVELYNLMAYLLEVPPAPNNGTWGSLHHLLKNPPTETTPPSSLNLPKYSSTNTSCPFPKTQEELDEASNQSLYDCSQSTYDYQRLNLSSAMKNSLEQTHVSHGLPSFHHHNSSDLCILHQDDFVSLYNRKLKLPLWSSFRLRSTSSQINLSEASDGLVPDVRISPSNQFNCSELIYNNISLVPLFHTNLSASTNSKEDSLLLTNMVPMDKRFFKDVWLHILETAVKHFNGSDFIVGPIFDEDANGVVDDLNELVDIFIPTHYFIIILPNSTSTPNFETVSFVLPNSPDGPSDLCQKLEQYMSDHTVRIRDIELLTGLKFLTDQKDSVRTKTHISTRTFKPRS